MNKNSNKLIFALAAKVVEDFGIDEMPAEPLCGVLAMVAVFMALMQILEPLLIDMARKYSDWDRVFLFFCSLIDQVSEICGWIFSTGIVRIASGMQMSSSSAAIISLMAFNAVGIADFRKAPENK